MPYSTDTDLAAEIGDRYTLLIGTMETSDVEALIANVDSYIDDMIRQAFTTDVTLPIAAADLPAVIAKISRKLSKYELYARNASVDVPDVVQKEYDWAEKTLREIRDRKLIILADEDATDDDDVQYTCGTQFFSEDMV